MGKKRWLARLAVAMGLVIVLPASVAQGSGERRFGGPRVMPGGVVVGDRIVYQEGAVVIVPAAAESFDSCPSGWVCLFQDTNWGGAMLQTTSTSWINLADYGFNDITSSWRNRKNVDAQIGLNPGGAGSKLCLNNGSYASSMPSGWDNAVSSVRVRDASTYC